MVTGHARALPRQGRGFRGLIALKIDKYVLQARVAPLAAALFPVAVVAGILGIPERLVSAAIVAVVGPTVLALIGADLVRSIGRDLEHKIWNEYGGSPTTRMFLANDETGIDRRRRLQAVTGVPVVRERSSVERATSALRDLAQDPQTFPRIPVANADYGRARNLLALRPYALSIAAICDTVLVYALTPLPMSELVTSLPSAQILVAALLCALATAFWIMFPSKHRLRRAGDDYADRLLAALDVLSSSDAPR